MRSIWAVATNTIKQAIRMKVAVVFLILLLILLSAMGFSATGDGTLKGRLQTFVSYGLSLTSILLSLLTIIISIYTVTSDIEQRQIYTVITKPIRRFEFLLGKLLGVILLDVILLSLFAAIIYTITIYTPKFTKATELERMQAYYEFFTARASMTVPPLDVSQEVEDTYNKLKTSDALPDNVSDEEIIARLTMQKQLAKRAADVGQVLTWEFDNVKSLAQHMFIRFKYDVAVNPPDMQVYGRWIAGDYQSIKYGTESETPIYDQLHKNSVRDFHEIVVPAEYIPEHGHLAVAFQNYPLNNTVIFFPPDGIEVLYKADTFTGNFIRVIFLILFRLIFLACLGTLASTFLSFPVAILLCLVLFTTSCFSGFVIESFGFLSENVSVIYTYTIRWMVRLLPQFDKYNPTKFMVPGLLLSWTVLARCAAVMVGIKSLLLLVLALIIFSYREIAKIIV
ncbi:MAG: hypothetical protein ACYS3N_09390 [Planctomycetota bacterium]|jgi:hypothetical protein